MQIYDSIVSSKINAWLRFEHWILCVSNFQEDSEFYQTVGIIVLCLQSRDKISKHLRCLDNKRWRHSAALHISIFTSSTFTKNKETSQLFGQICVNAQGSDSHCIICICNEYRDSKLPVVKETHSLLLKLLYFVTTDFDSKTVNLQ